MSLGKYLIIIGLSITVFGLIILFFNKFAWFGNLVGDFRYEKNNIKIFAPFTSMILISVIITIFFNLFNKIFK